MSATTRPEHGRETVTREAVIAREQEAVDHAYVCLERMRAETEKMVLDPGGANAKDSAELLRQHRKRLEAYDDLADKPLVIMRVDTVTGDGGDGESFYIGRRNVVDEQRERVVISWTAEAAVRWRQARQSDPGEVRLRGVLHCDRQRVRDFHDEIHLLPAPGLADVRGPADSPLQPVPASAGGEAFDPFLVQELEQARDGRMRDIVETIQREQLDLVADGRPGVLMVQGGPGTGKTAVGLHRVTWLLDNRGWEAEDVLVVGPHQEFLDFVSTVLPALGSRGVRTMELSRMWGTGTAPQDTGPRARIKSDLRMAELLRRAVEGVARPERLEDFVEYGAFTITGGGMSAEVERADLDRYLEDALTRPGSLRDQRDQFLEPLLNGLAARVVRFLSEEERKARGKEQEEGQEEGAVKEEIVVDSRLRAWVEQHPRVSALVNALWPLTDEERILRRLFGDRDVLARAAEDLFSEEEQRHLLNKPRTKVVWTQEDRVCLEELRFLVRGERPRVYRHIVLDEAQDLTPMQVRSLAQRCPDGSMTVLGDLAQATGPHRYANWGDFARSLGTGQWHTAELLVGYRVPRQVMEFAASVARRHAPGTEVPRSIREREGNALTLRRADTGTLLDELERRLWELEAATDGQRSIAVIIPEDVDIFVGAEEIAEAVAAKGKNARLVRVLSASEVNGLEFDHVVVVEPAAIVGEGPAGMGRLYVALTRYTQSLSVVHARPLPPELGGGEQDGDTSADGGSSGTVPKAGTVESPETLPEERETADTVQTAAAGVGLRAFVERAAEGAREDEEGQRLWHALMAELYECGQRPRHDDLVDVLSSGPEGRSLFQVLGKDGHTYAGMRQGVLRAREAAHVCPEEIDRICLVLPREPVEGWAVEVLCEMFGVYVVWRADRRWQGPDVSRVFGPEREEAGTEG
ncbi:AAA family ATPase [Nocardiopsis sp. FR4]|uniref:HelD family protein n=1 Tax=Nocardiopsis sp. FR4 TaxID=2605985 RepID=UPI001357BE4F|nr:AAA family ATPase [Nocardiopsis sp. FR4]